MIELPHHSTYLAGSDKPLNAVHDLTILDLDGVVFLGPKTLPGVTETISKVREGGMHVAFLTNNASRPVAEVAQRLSDRGVPATDFDVVTSAQVAASLLAERWPAGTPILVIGGAGLIESLKAVKLIPVTRFDDPVHPPQAVVQGFHPDVGWHQLNQAARAVRAGLPWLATNMDLTFPTEFGPAPGNGSLVRAVTAAAKHEPDQVAGKPEAAPFKAAVARYGSKRPMVVGDRLDTDIEGATNAKLPAMVVLTGVTGPAELLAAKPHCRPTYVGYDLAALLETHPDVKLGRDRAQCGQAEVTMVNGRLEAQLDSVEPLDVLRAACALSWAVADAGATTLEFAQLLDQLDPLIRESRRARGH